MSDAIESARRTIRIEAAAASGLQRRLGEDFQAAVDLILASTGRVIVCGMGKSGIIAHKIAATLASTGTPSVHLHPGEAYHGDLGLVTTDDVFVAISNSGETDEVVKLLPFLRANGNVMIALTGRPTSTLATAAAAHLDVSVAEEACPLQLAPTASTTAALVMGDALAVALMEARGFQPEDYARFHPGGTLGRRLLARVDDEMRTEVLPVVAADADFSEIVSVITRTKLGLALVREDAGWAIITDGDLRRAIETRGRDVFDLDADALMTRNPARVPAGTRMEDALGLMARRSISSLLVFDGEELVGVITR